MARGGIARGAILFLYLLVLVASPVFHHDIDCHIKTPDHCPACGVHPAAPPAAIAAVLCGGVLPEAGEITSIYDPGAPSVVRVEIPGRAPPSA